MTTEKAIAQAIVAYLRSLPRAYAHRVWTGGPQAHGGEPDIDAVVDGRAVKLEVKRPQTRHRVTPLQQRALDRWQRAGAVVGVVCSVDDVRDLLDEALVVVRRDEAADPEGPTASR